MDIHVDQSKIKTTVCIYYLDDTCKKSAEECDFLHAYVPDKLPICKYGKECRKEDCKLRHPEPEGGAYPRGAPNESCPYYERGYCSQGPLCRFYISHSLSWMMMLNNMGGGYGICTDFMAGFCPKGPECKFKHLKSVVIDDQTSLKEIANFPQTENYSTAVATPAYRTPMKYNMANKPTVCHNCGKEGHKSTFC